MISPIDEATAPEKLPKVLFKWLYKATTETQIHPENSSDVFNALKLALRLLAVKSPTSQSHALRSALGNLIRSIAAQKQNEQVCVDILGLLVRMVDAKMQYKYNPMKHLAISGLGHLAVGSCIQTKQNSANIFVLCFEALKVAPPEYLDYKNTIIWSLSKSVTDILPADMIKTSVRIAKSMIESSNEVSVSRGFDFLAAVINANAGQQYFSKRIDSSFNLFYKYGASSEHASVQRSSAKFYGALLTKISAMETCEVVELAVQLYKKLLAQKYKNSTSNELLLNCRLNTYKTLLCELVMSLPAGKEFAQAFDEWAADLLLQLDPDLSEMLVVKIGFSSKLIGDQVKCKAVDGMLKILTRAYPLNTALFKQKAAVLESVLVCISGGISLLRGAVQLVADPIHLATMGVILNSSANLPDKTIGYVASTCVSLILAEPKLLTPTMELCLKQFDNPQTVSYSVAVVLSRVIAVSKKLPLFGDVNLMRKSTELALLMVKERLNLKSYKIAWTLLSGIFKLGGGPIKPLISQLLNLWENHLSVEAVKYPEFVEQSLSGMVVFLANNSNSLTKDVLRRIGRLLNIVWNSIESEPVKQPLRRRLLQCYNLLLDCERSDIYPASLLTKYVAHISSASGYDKEKGCAIKSAVNTSMSLSRQQSESKKIRKLVANLEPNQAIEAGMSFINPQRDDDLVFWMLAPDTDSDSDSDSDNGEPQVCNDLYTDVVNLAVSVTAKMMRSQPLRIQESVLNAVHSDLSSAVRLNSMRKVAVVHNISKFMLQSFENGMILTEPRNIQIAVEILKLLLRSSDQQVRLNGAKCSEMLFKTLDKDPQGFPLMLSFARELISTGISSTDHPHVRGGACLALGFIARSVSHTALFEAVDKILLPLTSDQNEVVFTSVVSGLAALFTSKDNLDSKFINKTLKALTGAYLQNSKSSLTNFQLDIASILVQMVSRLGPQLASENYQTTGFLIQALAGQLQNSQNIDARMAADNVFIELFYFVRHEVNWKFCTARWIQIIGSNRSAYQEIEVACGGILTVLKDSQMEIASTVEFLWDALWLVLDRYPNHSGARELIRFFMHQRQGNAAALFNWLQLLGLVISKPRQLVAKRFVKQQPKAHQVSKKNDYAADLDRAMDEDESLGIVSDEHDNELFNWEARRFAVELLWQMLHLVGDYTPENISKLVGDIVKVAFSAATSTVVGLQLSGLDLLNEIVIKFGNMPDPDFPQISLLEQYQVQIGTALTSVFNHESSPSLVIAGLQTCCSVFDSSIMRNKEWFSKLFKILELAVEGMQTSELFQLGDLEMTYDAAEVLQIGVLGVWAQIQISSVTNKVLLEVVEPRISLLTLLWGQHIGEFARLTYSVSTEFSATSFTDAINQMKDAQDKELLTPAYDKTWLLMVKALTTVDEEERQNQLSLYNSNDFFFMLFGLSTQALISCLNPMIISYPPGLVLETLEAILAKPENSRAISSEILFMDEFIPVLYRAMMIGSNNQQLNILKIIQHLSKELNLTEENIDLLFDMMKTAILPLRQSFPFLFDSQISSVFKTADASETPTPDTNETLTQTQKLTREALESAQAQQLGPNDITLLRLALETMIDIAKDFPSIIQSDLWVCLIKIFEEINNCEPAIAAPSFRDLLESVKTYIRTTSQGSSNVLTTLLETFKRVCQGKSTKQALLVCTGILCTNSESFDSEAGLFEVQQYCNVLNATLEETNEQLNTAFQCLVMIFKSCPKTRVCDLVINQCFPTLLNLALSAAKLTTSLQATDALTVYTILNPSQPLVHAVVTVILKVVKQSSKSTERSKQQLMQIVTKQPQTFKSVVLAMAPNDRQQLQSLLADSDKPSTNDEFDEEEENSIQLATFE